MNRIVIIIVEECEQAVAMSPVRTGPKLVTAPRPVLRVDVADTLADDAALVKRLADGDDTAFTEIYDRYASRIRSRISQMMPAEDIDELINDTFMRARRGVGNFRGDSSLLTWLTRIALNLTRNRYWYEKRRGRDRSLSLDAPLAADDSSGATFGDTLQDEGVASPRTKIIGDEFTRMLEAAWSTLTPKHVQVLEMRVGRHMLYEEIAVALDINVGTVKSRIARARTELSSELMKLCPDMTIAKALHRGEWLTDD